MGCGSAHNVSYNSMSLDKIHFLACCKIFKDFIIHYKKCKSITLSCYIISKTSISGFISLIDRYKILDNLENNILKLKNMNNHELEIKDISLFNKDKEYSFYIETRGEVYSKSEIIGIGVYDGEYGYFLKEEEIDKYRDIFTSKCNKYTYLSSYFLWK